MLDTLHALATQPVKQRIAGVKALCNTLEDGQAKLLVVSSALALRTRWPDLFLYGKYLPLAVKGVNAAHVCAYARILDKRVVITLSPRFFAELLGETRSLPLGDKVWADTTVDLPFHHKDMQYKCVFTGKVLSPLQRGTGWALSMALALTEFPVGLIVGESIQADSA
jgi:(1->4)-alpha-D-glucan 1-alpha-D-glucosylmutase